MSHTIRIEGNGDYVVADAADTLLRGALRAGLGFPHECSVGGCGACRYELVDGRVETLWEQAPGLSERDRKRGKRLACQSRPLSDCTLRVRCEEAYRPPVSPRRRTVTLAQRRMLTHDMALVEFHGAGPADFLPGQYALFELPGVAGARAYSMSNLPNADGRWEFIIRRTPGGSASGRFVDTLAVGTELAMDGPYGGAYYRAESPRAVVCIAGGSGLAPMLAVARAAMTNPAASASNDRPLDFFFGGRTAADLCAEPLLAELPGYGDRLRLHAVVSDATDADWQGARGFVHEAVERTLGQALAEKEIYFAGPPPMIEAIQQLLMVRCRVPYQQIHFDRFV